MPSRYSRSKRAKGSLATRNMSSLDVADVTKRATMAWQASHGPNLPQMTELLWRKGQKMPRFQQFFLLLGTQLGHMKQVKEHKDEHVYMVHIWLVGFPSNPHHFRLDTQRFPGHSRFEIWTALRCTQCKLRLLGDGERWSDHKRPMTLDVLNASRKSPSISQHHADKLLTERLQKSNTLEAVRSCSGSVAAL